MIWAMIHKTKFARIIFQIANALQIFIFSLMLCLSRHVAQIVPCYSISIIRSPEDL